MSTVIRDASARGESAALRAATAAIRSPFPRASRPSGKTGVSASPVLMPWPRWITRWLTAHEAMPSPWCTCSRATPAREVCSRWLRHARPHQPGRRQAAPPWPGTQRRSVRIGLVGITADLAFRKGMVTRAAAADLSDPARSSSAKPLDGLSGATAFLGQFQRGLSVSRNAPDLMLSRHRPGRCRVCGWPVCPARPGGGSRRRTSR